MSNARLSPKQLMFVAEYLVDLNATAAYKRAGYSFKNDNVAGVEANRLLNKPQVQAAIVAAMRERSERLEITQDQVLQKWWSLANADPNELVEFRRRCCRHCHGIDFGYQRTVSEMNSARRQHARDVAACTNQAQVSALGDFDEAGGIGYDARRPPVLACTHCWGDGVGEAFFKPTANLSPEARALYAGVKQTKEGFEVKMQARDKALEMVARHLGMFIDRKEIGGPGDFADLTEEELDRQISETERQVRASGGAVH